MRKRILAMFLTIALVLGMLPASVLAADETPAPDYMAAHAGAITVDGQCDELSWALDRVMGTGDNARKFGILWDKNNLYIAVEKKAGDGDLAVQLNGAAATPVSSAVGAVTELQIALPVAVADYGYTAELAFSLGEVSWSGTVGVSSMERTLIPGGEHATAGAIQMTASITAGAAETRQTKTSNIGDLGDATKTNTLEFDFVAAAMPVNAMPETSYGIWPCEGFVVANMASNTQAYVGGIGNTENGLVFCLRYTNQTVTTVELGRTLNQTFHIRLDWTPSGQLLLYRDGELLHTFTGTRTANPYGNAANMVMYELYSPAGKAEDREINFTVSNMRMGSALNTVLDSLVFADIANGNISAGSVVNDLSLPTQWVDAQLAGVELQWTSSHPEAVSVTGVVTPQLVDTVVELTATLVSDPTVDKTIAVTVPAIVMDANYSAAITADGTLSESAWGGGKDFAVGTGKVSALWNKDYIYLAVHCGTTQTMELTLGEHTWELIPGDIAKTGLSGKWSNGIAELAVKLSDLDITLSDYRQTFPIQIVLDGTSKLGENPIVLRTVAAETQWLDITSSGIAAGFVYDSALDAIKLDAASATARRYWFIENVVDSTKNQYLQQTIRIDAMPVSTGTTTNYGDADGYYFWINDTSKKWLAWANLYNHAENGLVLKVTNINGGGAYKEVILGKNVGDTFTLGFNWTTGTNPSVFTDDLIEVYVDGALKDTIANMVCSCDCGGSKPVVLNYKSPANSPIKMTISDVCFLGAEKYTSLLDEMQQKGTLSALESADTITSNLTLPASFTSDYLGELELTWSSSDKNVITDAGAVTQPANKVGKYVTLTLSVGDNKVWSKELYVPATNPVADAGLVPLLVPYAQTVPTLDQSITDSDGWNLNSRIVYQGTTQLARFGVQWDEENLYIAVDKPNTNAVYVFVNDQQIYAGPNQIVEIKKSFQELGITVDDYGTEIPVAVKINNNDQFKWEGNLVLTSTEWFAIDGTGERMKIFGMSSQSLGTGAKTENQGYEKLDTGWRLYDKYDANDNNPTQYRTGVTFGGPDSAEGTFDKLDDRTVANYMEFDVRFDSMPVYSEEEATLIGGYGCYGLSWVMSDAAAATKISNIISMGIFNSEEGLKLTIQNSTQNTKREFVKLNRYLGDLFRIGIRWETNGDVTVLLDGELLVVFKDKEYGIMSWGNNSVGFSIIRSPSAAQSSNDNIDVSITNIAVGKNYGDSILDSLTEESILDENTSLGQVNTDLELPNPLKNNQFKNGVALTWSADPAIIDADGKVTRPEGNGQEVTLTATLGNGSKKEFDVYVMGQNPQTEVLAIEEDFDPSVGKGLVTDVANFIFDAHNNSLIYDQKTARQVNLITLMDSDASNRLNESVLTIWISDDNETYEKVDSFKILRDGVNTYLYGFDVTARYIKVHCTHYTSQGSDFDGKVGNMLKVGYDASLSLTGEMTVVTVTNTDAVTRYDEAWTLEASGMDLMKPLRVFMEGQLLYHYVDDGKLIVRIPQVNANSSVSLQVKGCDENALKLDNKEYTYEVVYGTREVTKVYDRFVTTLPDGRLIMVTTSLDENLNAKLCLAYRYSSDKGATWTDQVEIDCTRDLLQYSGGVTYDPNTGRILAHGIGNFKFVGNDMEQSVCQTRVIYSDDLGMTWQMAPIWECDGKQTNYYLSYCDPVVLSSHDSTGDNVDLVIPMGAQYNNEGGFCVRVAYSKDAGLTWRLSETEIVYSQGEGSHVQEAGTSEATIAEGVDGEGRAALVLFARCQFENSNNFIRAYSYDNGVTWTANAEMSDVYTTNTQPMLFSFDGEDMLCWGGNTVLGGNSYQRYPLTVGVSYDGLQTFEGMQDLFSRYSLQGMTSADGNNVVNPAVHAVGDSLIIGWGNNAAEILQMRIDDFSNYFYRTKGAYDSFENSTVKAEGWSATAGTVAVVSDKAAEGIHSMSLSANAAAVRSIPYLQDGQITFQLYVGENANMTIELESAYSDVFGMAAPIALEVVNGNLGGVSLNANQWNTISFDLNLSAATASAILKVNDAVADVALNTSIGDYICYVDINTNGSACYVDNFLVVDNDSQTVPEEPITEPKVVYRSVSLKGNIGVNYYMEIPADMVDDTDVFMRFTMADGDVVEVPLANAIEQQVNGKSYHVFTCQVAAKEMSDIITAQFFYGENSTEPEEYSVAAYAYELLEDTTGQYDAVKPLVQAMLNYGAAAQAHFSYNTDNPANADLEEKPDYSVITAETLVDFVGSGTGTENAVYSGNSLLLKSETSLRFFFQVAESETLTVTCNGEPLTATERNGMQYVAVENIAAKDLDTAYTLIVNGEEITASALTYAYNVLSAPDGTYTDNLENLVKALYLYNQEANDYFPNN